MDDDDKKDELPLGTEGKDETVNSEQLTVNSDEKKEPSAAGEKAEGKKEPPKGGADEPYRADCWQGSFRRVFTDNEELV